jgi:demethylmenaquinone methyltransferase/2-methoxy-6-polyprenyl-1,4-benzoquinol methylase
VRARSSSQAIACRVSQICWAQHVYSITSTGGGEVTTARVRRVGAMFDRIADRYDLMNRLMTAGLDGRWRRGAVSALGLRAGDRALDLGCGTGDLAAAMRRAGAAVVGVDVAGAMLRRGVVKEPSLVPVLADARHLPFRDSAFDAVGTAFTVRNVPDLPTALAEVRRVLRPGGRFAVLDLTRPEPSTAARLFRLYTDRMIPLAGGLISGDFAAYRYLAASVRSFVSGQELRAAVLDAGFARVSLRRLAPGEVTLLLANT